MRGVDITRALLLPTSRTLPLRALSACAALGLLVVASPRLLGGGADAALSLNLLRAGALSFGLGLAFLLDDPARHTTAAVPARRALRRGLRVALVVPFAALWWAAALLLVPARARPPLGAVTLEAAAVALLALAAAAVAVRCTDAPEPGPATAGGLLATALVAPVLPERWTLLAGAGDPNWGPAHERWALLLAGAALVVTVCACEPVRTRRVTSLVHR